MFGSSHIKTKKMGKRRKGQGMACRGWSRGSFTSTSMFQCLEEMHLRTTCTIKNKFKRSQFIIRYHISIMLKEKRKIWYKNEKWLLVIIMTIFIN